MNILDYLNHKLPLIDRQFDSINAGGCAIFAYTLAKELKDTLNIDAKILWLEDHKITKDIIHKAIKEVSTQNGGNFNLKQLNSYGVWCSHVMLMINKHVVDSTGVHPSINCTRWGYYNPIEDVMDIDTLKVLCDNPDGWNFRFDRSQIESIAKEIKKTLKEYKNKYAKNLVD